MDWVDKSMRLLIISFVYLTRDISIAMRFTISSFLITLIMVTALILFFHLLLTRKKSHVLFT